jgi:hypothetical protein
MIAVLTQPEGLVTVTDGVDKNHEIPSFPELQKRVAAMTDDLTGELAGVKETASYITSLVVDAQRSAADSATAAANSEASAARSDDSAAASAQSANDSAASATASEASNKASAGSAAASAACAKQSADSATKSATSAALSGDEADDSAASASTALLAAGDALSSRNLSQAWAVNAEDVPVQAGEFSAKHWAKKAQSFATGSLVYLGAWDASKGTLPSGAKKGAFYKIIGGGLASPENVAVKAAKLDAPNGTNKSFQLLDDAGRAITTGIAITALRRTDWQGSVALSPNPRTNFIWPSNGPSRRSINGAANVTLTEGVSDPRGGTQATRVVATNTIGGFGPFWSGSAQALTNGTTYDFVIAMRGLKGGEKIRFCLESALSAPITLTNSYQVFRFTATYVGTGALVAYFQGTAVPGESGFEWCDVGALSKDGAFIQTATGPVTVTDYTVNAAGLVTLAEAPRLDATLDWDGAGTTSPVMYRVGDNIVHNGVDWDLIDNTESVTAVAGKVGNVTLVPADITGLQTVLDGKAGANHSHAIADVVNLQATLDAKLPKTGGTVTGEVTATAFRAGGISGPAYYVGNDAMIVDIDRANTIGIQGQTSTGDGGIMLGVGGPLLTGNANGLVVASNKTVFQGTTTTNGEVISLNANSFRIAYGPYGVFWRQDGSDLYLMMTNANDAYGSWNALRPFTVKVSTGAVTFAHTVTFNGRAAIQSDLALGSRYVRGNGSQIEFVNSPYSAVVNIFGDNGVILGADFQIWSDRRLKTEIKDLDFDAVDVLRKMPPRHYLKHNIAMEPVGYEYGFIHDEVEAVLPDATQRTEGTEDVPNVGSVASPQLVAVLAQAVLQLSERLDKAGIA